MEHWSGQAATVVTSLSRAFACALCALASLDLLACAEARPEELTAVEVGRMVDLFYAPIQTIDIDIREGSHWSEAAGYPARLRVHRPGRFLVESDTISARSDGVRCLHRYDAAREFTWDPVESSQNFYGPLIGPRAFSSDYDISLVPSTPEDEPNTVTLRLRAHSPAPPRLITAVISLATETRGAIRTLRVSTESPPTSLWTTFDLTTMRINEPLDPALFDATPPEGYVELSDRDIESSLDLDPH